METQSGETYLRRHLSKDGNEVRKRECQDEKKSISGKGNRQCKGPEVGIGIFEEQ